MENMETLTVGLKIVNERNDVFIMRYSSSKNWTIPNTVVGEKEGRNDTIYFTNVMKLVPTGLNIISINKIACIENRETIKSDDNDKIKDVLIRHDLILFESSVETVGDLSLLDIPLKFDYAQWVHVESLICIPFTNRITRALMDYEKSKTPTPKAAGFVL